MGKITEDGVKGGLFMANKGKYYMTTAITYTSGKPHIGNTYEIILTDAIARFKRQMGYDVYFLTGSDEHGQKVQDLANLRGLVMAEVSELDEKMEDVLRKYYVQNVTEELKNTFHDHITKKNEERFKKNLEGCGKKEKVCYHKWKGMEIQDIIPLMEAAQMAKAVNYIVPKELYTPFRVNFFEDYKAEIVEIRNELAHCASKTEDGKEILTTRKGDKTFNDEDIKEIRKNILKYSKIFDKLLQ